MEKKLLFALLTSKNARRGKSLTEKSITTICQRNGWGRVSLKRIPEVVLQLVRRELMQRFFGDASQSSMSKLSYRLNLKALVSICIPDVKTITKSQEQRRDKKRAWCEPTEISREDAQNSRPNKRLVVPRMILDPGFPDPSTGGQRVLESACVFKGY